MHQANQVRQGLAVLPIQYSGKLQRMKTFAIQWKREFRGENFVSTTRCWLANSTICACVIHYGTMHIPEWSTSALVIATSGNVDCQSDQLITTASSVVKPAVPYSQCMQYLIQVTFHFQDSKKYIYIEREREKLSYVLLVTSYNPETFSGKRLHFGEYIRI